MNVRMLEGIIHACRKMESFGNEERRIQVSKASTKVRF